MLNNLDGFSSVVVPCPAKSHWKVVKTLPEGRDPVNLKSDHNRQGTAGKRKEPDGPDK